METKCEIFAPNLRIGAELVTIEVAEEVDEDISMLDENIRRSHYAVHMNQIRSG